MINAERVVSLLVLWARSATEDYIRADARELEGDGKDRKGTEKQGGEEI